MKKSYGQIIRRYATALFELSVESQAVPLFVSDAKSILSLLDQNTLAMFKHPGYSVASKKEVLSLLSSSIHAQPLMVRFLDQVLENRRISVIREILQDFLTRADEYMGIKRVDIFSARPLSGEDLADFEKTLTQSLNKKVIITPKVDESLKAGYIVRIGNTIVDASLRSRLASIKESLSQGV